MTAVAGLIFVVEGKKSETAGTAAGEFEELVVEKVLETAVADNRAALAVQ
jgi:hypothetical protein